MPDRAKRGRAVVRSNALLGSCLDILVPDTRNRPTSPAVQVQPVGAKHHAVDRVQNEPGLLVGWAIAQPANKQVVRKERIRPTSRVVDERPEAWVVRAAAIAGAA
jgi:hypothetical protein